MPLESPHLSGLSFIRMLVVVGCGLGLQQAMAGASKGATSASGIFTCTDSQGRKITSDRPIPDCLDREQRVLNHDGSQRKVVPPRQTLEEKLRADELAREQERQAQIQQAAVRRDRKLLQRYPDEKSHAAAREKALDDVRDAMARSELRVKALKRERKTLQNETEFYQGKTVPLKLRSDVDANEASLAAQARMIDNHQAELKRINATYDEELSRLRKLWAGAAPGSIPPASPTP